MTFPVSVTDPHSNRRAFALGGWNITLCAFQEVQETRAFLAVGLFSSAYNNDVCFLAFHRQHKNTADEFDMGSGHGAQMRFPVLLFLICPHLPDGKPNHFV